MLGFGFARGQSPLRLAGLAAALLLAWPATAGAQGTAKVPDFSGLWVRKGPDPSTWEVPSDPKLRPGPLVNTLKSRTLWAADDKTPWLKPWVAKVVKQHGDSERAGVSVPVPHNLCWPEGTPSVLNLRENVQLLQTPKEVTILFQRGPQFRHVYLNVAHSKNPPKSWNGESVGHYEGDTLVVDTIGINNKAGIDRYGTPHSDQLHTVERYRVIDGGKTLRVTVRIEDPKAYNAVWYAQASYRRSDEPFQEIVCAENNYDVLTKQEYPIPRDFTPDF